MQRILVFTGAGISVPLGLPSTKDFLSAVTQKGMVQPVTQNVIEHLNAESGRGHDIEWILSALEAFQKNSPLTEFLIPKLGAGDHRAQQTVGQIQRGLSEYKSQAAQEIIRIKKIVFDKLTKFENQTSLSIYINLWKEIRSKWPESSLSIFTTNYDLAFETAIISGMKEWKAIGVHDVDYGFTSQMSQFVYNPSQDFNWKHDCIEYLKLHGSLDWHRDVFDNCTRSMAPTKPENPDDMPILYPGFKGVPEKEPFASIHNRLVQRLSEADAVIVIGFAFRDAYINNIFENVLRTRKNLTILYFNPIKINEFPPDSDAPRFINSYKNFVHIKRGIGITEDSLGLDSAISK